LKSVAKEIRPVWPRCSPSLMAWYAERGAASGTLGGYLTDVGIDDKWMKEAAAAIQPGTAALFVLVRKVTADKVLEGLKGEGGTVLKTSLDHTKESALQAALADVQTAVPPPPA
jgi:uncharacterized membrane protein